MRHICGIFVRQDFCIGSMCLYVTQTFATHAVHNQLIVFWRARRPAATSCRSSTATWQLPTSETDAFFFAAVSPLAHFSFCAFSFPILATNARRSLDIEKSRTARRLSFLDLILVRLRGQCNMLYGDAAICNAVIFRFIASGWCHARCGASGWCHARCGSIAITLDLVMCSF